MCEFFSSAYTQDDRLLFTEGNSHHDILIRARMQERQNVLAARAYVRLECEPPFGELRVDEIGELPAWFQEIWDDPVRRNELHQRVVKIARQIEAYEERARRLRTYLRVRVDRIENPFWQIYRDECARINEHRKVLLDGIERQMAPIRDQYPALSLERSEALRPLVAEKMRIQRETDKMRVDAGRLASQQCEPGRKLMQAAAGKINLRLIQQISRIPGYVPNPKIV